jgi:hypothetical protein
MGESNVANYPSSMILEIVRSKSHHGDPLASSLVQSHAHSGVYSDVSMQSYIPGKHLITHTNASFPLDTSHLIGMEPPWVLCDSDGRYGPPMHGIGGFVHCVFHLARFKHSPIPSKDLLVLKCGIDLFYATVNLLVYSVYHCKTNIDRVLRSGDTSFAATDPQVVIVPMTPSVNRPSPLQSFCEKKIPSGFLVCTPEFEECVSGEGPTNASGAAIESDNKFVSLLPSAADLNISDPACGDHFITAACSGTADMDSRFALYSSIVQMPSISAWSFLRLLALPQVLCLYVVLTSFIMSHPTMVQSSLNDWQCTLCPIDFNDLPVPVLPLMLALYLVMAFYAIMFQYRGKPLAIECTAFSLKRLLSHQPHVPIEDMENLSVWFPVLPSVMLCCHTALCRLQPVVGAVISALAIAHHRGRVLVFVAQDSCTARELFSGWRGTVERLLPPTENIPLSWLRALKLPVF